MHDFSTYTSVRQSPNESLKTPLYVLCGSLTFFVIISYPPSVRKHVQTSKPNLTYPMQLHRPASGPNLSHPSASPRRKTPLSRMRQTQPATDNVQPRAPPARCQEKGESRRNHAPPTIALPPYCDTRHHDTIAEYQHAA